MDKIPIFKILAVAAYFIVSWLQPVTQAETKLTRNQKIALMIAAFLGGGLFGRLPFLLFPNLPLIEPTIGANTITMGLVGAYLFVEVTKYFIDVRFKTGDRFALPLSALICIGRWNCFFDECCRGIETELAWGVVFTGDEFARHPTQIYESFFHGTVFLSVLLMTKFHVFETHRLQFYLLTYCLYRFLTEFIRPEPSILFGMTYYQIVMLLFGIFLGVQWFIESRNEPNLLIEKGST